MLCPGCCQLRCQLRCPSGSCLPVLALCCCQALCCCCLRCLQGGSSGSSSSAGLGAEAAQVAAPGADWGARELWGRWYVMRQGGAPLCVIYEVFSPLLEAHLGRRHLDVLPAPV